MKTYEIPYDLDHETEPPNMNLVLSNYPTIKWLGSGSCKSRRHKQAAGAGTLTPTHFLPQPTLRPTV